MRLAMGPYFASNFTFFLCLSWTHPYLMEHYELSRDSAAWYSTVVLIVGATGRYCRLPPQLKSQWHVSRWRTSARR